MALTYTEKQHWSNRIRKLIDVKVAELYASIKPVKDGFKAKAKEEITGELDLDEKFDEYDSRAEEIVALQLEQKELVDSIAATVYGEDLPYHVNLADIKREIDSLVDERAENHFAQHQLGIQLQMLNSEKERLLDEMLLAVNVQQVSRLLDEAAELDTSPKAELIVEEQEDLCDLPLLLLPEYSYQVQ